jgi:hypothetical protein
VALSPAEEESIREFQERRREFRPHWYRNALFLGLPGFLLFVFGGALPAVNGGQARPWMVWLGIALFLAAMARGGLLLHRHLRCPKCEYFQRPSWRYPYRVCAGCGVRLSVGVRDSA